MDSILLLLYYWNFLLLGNCFLLVATMIRILLLFMTGRLIIFCTPVLFRKVRSMVFHGRMNYNLLPAVMIMLNSGPKVRVKWVHSRVNSKAKYVVYHHPILFTLLVVLKVISLVGQEILSHQQSKHMLVRCNAYLKNKILSFQVAMMV